VVASPVQKPVVASPVQKPVVVSAGTRLIPTHRTKPGSYHLSGYFLWGRPRFRSRPEACQSPGGGCPARHGYRGVVVRMLLTPQQCEVRSMATGLQPAPDMNRLTFCVSILVVVADCQSHGGIVYTRSR
jgi:hypothetical protein